VLRPPVGPASIASVVGILSPAFPMEAPRPMKFPSAIVERTYPGRVALGRGGHASDIRQYVFEQLGAKLYVVQSGCLRRMLTCAETTLPRAHRDVSQTPPQCYVGQRPTGGPHTAASKARRELSAQGRFKRARAGRRAFAKVPLAYCRDCWDYMITACNPR
jgi:hypothetical protein